MKAKQKNILVGFFVFLTLFILSLDFWGWGQPVSAESLFLGLPIWIYYLLFLTIATSIFFYILAKNVWRGKN